ncbi:MAG: putative Hybrid PKS-NRPS biosynthetic cluster [Bathelium mastoideum]|nr:MAG: putative Hybrid PKS-NRPS biosynthetic cluster [Bathelium mastoideum]
MTGPIAIVGSACRFPGEASSPSQLWDLLKAPRDVVRQFPSERLNLSSFYSKQGEQHGSTDVQDMSYLLQEDCRTFDAAFFRINPKEAHGMDPQQRLLLETVYEAVEAAGCPLEELEGSKTGVYVGVMTSDFNDIQMRDPETLPTYTATGLARSILSNRISYFFDLKGPSMTIDTACSSSLVALHQAVCCLGNGDATQAIVAGTTLLLDPSAYIAESKLHMLSPDSRSRMWDKDANGYARGEGCAAVLLKPLSRAIEANDDIECVIRATAVNSDGRTNGLTMPSAIAQTNLIRETYHKAGLDITTDRCQFFECHGTGTSAGDPVEAQAIHEAFFPGSSLTPNDDNTEPLYCGSVKTVIGHLEGCAGLASILKVSLALHNKLVPPNMHFNQLSPSIEPYYNNLCVPTSLLPWPETHGKPLRASVNSFGFGGTNAHAILERFEPPAKKTSSLPCSEQIVGPLVFSAKSRSSLLRTLQNTSAYIQQEADLDLSALAYVLQSRRSVFPVRSSVAATNRHQLLQSLNEQIRIAEATANAALAVRALATDPDQDPKLLGVFTGQGAQWATMGKELAVRNSIFRESLSKCESALKGTLAAPSWSLLEQLMKESAESRIAQAQFSQPLCTAVQIALVDLFHAIGIRFDTVVGHSSGEIGAAYAAGVLSLRDAMGIAYYRGLVAHMAGSDVGQRGGMMAVGLSFDAAEEFCHKPHFNARIRVAASNAPASVTLSGDADAIQEAKQIFEEEGIFARVLKVDTAYHSHHMLRCVNQYRDYLKQQEIKVHRPREGCTWASSVYGDVDMLQGPLKSLTDQYWVDNMVQPVLFSQAVEFALLQKPSLALALEVGPHPVLKGPIGQTMKALEKPAMPYVGSLERGKRDSYAISAALGHLWSYLGPAFVNFNVWRNLGSHDSRKPRLLKGLPSYSWDHETVYWHESRISNNYRLGTDCQHELLGRLREDTLYEMTWRNVLHLSELPWLDGHAFQGQTIFPAAGYASIAIQAALSFARGRSVKMIEIHDMSIAKALTIEEDGAGVETLFTIRSHENVVTSNDESIVGAEFVCYSCSDQRVIDKACDGNLFIHFGTSGPEGPLPPSQMSQVALPPLSIDRFFKAVADLGIVYNGVFRTMRTIERTWGQANATALWAEGDLLGQYALHPAILDAAFQVGFAAFISIVEKAIGSTYLPSRIRRIIVDPAQTYRDASGETDIKMESHISRSDSSLIEVDINLCDGKSGRPGVQVDGLVLKAIAQPSPANDRLLFAKTVWDIDATFGLPSPLPRRIEQAELDYIDAVERTALFFLQNLSHTIRPEEISGFKWHHQQLLYAIQSFLDPIRQGSHVVLKKDWLNDSRDLICSFAKRYPDSADIALLTAVGENIASVLRGETDMLEHMLKDNLLGRLYTEGRGFAICNDYVAEFMGKISHKFPRTKILEIGAGTGGTTRSVLDAIGPAYSSYMYTDISAGFFEKAGEKFADHAHKMSFKTFNAESTPAQQGFTERSYDIVIAANVLHATSDLVHTMHNARALLQPGGFLIAVEVTGTMLREPGLMGGLQGWWLGAKDGRFPCPGISVKQWHDVLHKSGFSGVDTIAYDMPDVARHNCSVFVTQAVDERFNLLRDPLASVELIPETPVLILGGQSLPVLKAVHRAGKLLRRWSPHVKLCNSVEDLDPLEIAPETSVLCLTDLDRAIFSESISSKKLNNLQEMLASAKNVLWITSGRLAKQPHSNMMIGIGRALSFELPHVQIQFLDFDDENVWNMEMAVQNLLRMVLLSAPESLHSEMLWWQEPEVVVNNEATLVPRLIQDDHANQALNADRRRTKKIREPLERIELTYQNGALQLVTSDSPLTDTQDSIAVEIDVELSVALNLGSSADAPPFHLCFGRLRGGNRSSAFAISEVSTSLARATLDCVLMPSTDVVCHASTLVSMASALIASYIISNSPSDGTVLVHEPTTFLANIISKCAVIFNRNVLFVTSKSSEESPSGWITVHPLAHTRSIRRLIPTSAVVFWHWPNMPIQNILMCLPKNSIVHQVNPSLISCNEKTLAAAQELATSAATETAITPIVVNVSEFSDTSKTVDHERSFVVVDWRHTTPLEVAVPPLKTDSIFSPKKTYFMVGMTGELGQSLCRFMISCGARYIVLASRAPSIDRNWIDEMRVAGGEIRAVKMDVTDRSQVQNVVSSIRNTMPAFGGVANAALVLEDSLFLNTTVASIEKQLKPKVDGTIYLDEIFVDHELDFFVTFSSLGSVYGNAGQSIYHAANMFMMSLVEKRRRQGKVGSVIDVGMIVDVGYVAKSERAGSGIEEHLRSQSYTPLAETEFHHSFLQAVISGHPNSGHADVTMGVQPFIDDPDALTRPHWYENPRFSHMILPPTGSNSASKPSSSAQRLWERLQNPTSIPETAEVFEEIFSTKIEAIMKVPVSAIDVNAPLSDLGLDSLLGVEIRTWLLKNLHLDVPLLKILGRVSISSICLDAAHELLETVESKPNADQEKLNSTNEASRSQLGSRSQVTDPGERNLGAISAYSSLGSDAVSPSKTAPSRPAERNISHEASSSSTLSVFKFPVTSDKKEEDTESAVPIQYKKTERMTFAQASLHFLQSFLDDPTTFNVTVQYEIKGPLNELRFARAFEKTLARHEAYRTCFFTEPGNLQAKQAVMSDARTDRFIRLQVSDPDDVERSFQGFANQVRNLSIGQTFQAILFTRSPESHILVVGCHHIIMDGLSWNILLRDLDRAYNVTPLKPIAHSSMDFAREQYDALDSGRYEQSINYWMYELHPIPSVLPLLPLALTKARRARRTYGNHCVQRELSDNIVPNLKKASKACQATPMQFYLAVLQILLAHLLELDEVCIGVTDTGRGSGGKYAETIGHFPNLLPMRFRMGKEQSVAQLVKNTSQTVLNGYAHADAPIDVILERVGMQRSPVHSPLFQIAFNYRVGNLLRRTLGTCEMNLIRYTDAKNPYDLSFNVTQITEGINLLELSSSDYLYSKAATELIMDAYVNLLDASSHDQSTQLRDCRPYNDAAVQSALDLGRGPKVWHAWPPTLTERFGQICSTFKDLIAIKDSEGSMTYGELQCRTFTIATALLNAGASVDTRIAVFCEPSIDTYAAMMGILHVGAKYVPLDLSLPTARLRAMIDACRPKLLVHHSATAKLTITTLCGEDMLERMQVVNLSELPITAQEPPSAINVSESFLLFTSGSTGTPKGIRLSQSGIMNYAASKSAKLGLKQGVRVLQQSSTGFDMSLAQAFNAFANAGTLVVASSKARGDPFAIAELMLRESIQLTICTPSEYLMLATYAADTLRQVKSWEHACSGGETVPEKLLAELRRLELPELSLIDCYGPTEISCAATFRSISLQTNRETDVNVPSSVGKAIPNTSVYIVNSSGAALPPGFAGEICIGGWGVAKGYLDAQLNESKFVPDPFASAEDIAQGWTSMYRTGDKGSFREDGSLMFLGRMDGDTLVKLRGLRIELDEVASVLLQCSEGRLADAIVTVRGQPEFLVAHVWFARGEHLNQTELEMLCAELPLPRYMIPSMITPLDVVPTTPNGKVDRRAVGSLKLPTREESESKASIPLTVPEGELRLIWREVLGDAAGGVAIQADTDFFTVGGSSLLLVQLQNALKEKMGVELLLQDLYQASTLAKMAALTSKERSQLVEDTIDWTAETAIPAKFLENAQSHLPDPISTPSKYQRQVLLTGATGFLGSEILLQLIGDEDIAKIHCIAIAPDAQSKIAPHGKIITYPGSLLSPSLGLSASERAFFRTTIDQIIHAGAQGHCLNNYTSVRSANFYSTRFLASLALPRRIPLHLISSGRVVLQAGVPATPPVSLSAHAPPADGSQGFTASKWASEAFLERLVGELRPEQRLAVVIHRPCSLIGDRAPNDDAMNSIIKFSLLTRTVPDIPQAEGFFDFKNVVAVAEDIARGKIGLSEGQTEYTDEVDGRGVEFRHHSSGVKVPFGQLAERLHSLYGGWFKVVSMECWLQSAIEHGIEDLIVSYLRANVARGGNLLFPYLGMEKT